MLKILLGLGIALVVIAVAVLLVGFMLPQEHSASVRARYAAPPDSVYALIADVANGTAWRHDLDVVDVLSAGGEQLRWKEVADWGSLTFVRDTDEPGRRIVNHIVDEGQGFGGTWTFDIEPDGTGSTLRITEDGIVSNPIYRFMSRFVMGYYANMESYARDLGARFHETPTIERVEH